MPPLTRWYVKTSFVYLVLALTVGVLLAAGSTNAIHVPAHLFPVYIHLLVFGWLSQLIFGMVFWMFPKFSRERPRGYEGLGWLTYALLNAGLALRAAGELLLGQPPAILWGWVLVASALLQWLAGLAFVANTWPRVKEK
jgi:hypothetical protein